jgi:hypothetical protein
MPSGPVGIAMAAAAFVVLLLLVKPHSPWRRGLVASLRDLGSLFASLRGPRHVIHDKPYLDRVLEAESNLHASSKTRSPERISRPVEPRGPQPPRQEPDPGDPSHD